MKLVYGSMLVKIATIKRALVHQLRSLYGSPWRLASRTLVSGQTLLWLLSIKPGSQMTWNDFELNSTPAQLQKGRKKDIHGHFLLMLIFFNSNIKECMGGGEIWVDATFIFKSLGSHLRLQSLLTFCISGLP